MPCGRRQRSAECRTAERPAALEDDVGAAVGGAVHPPRLADLPQLVVPLVDDVEAERCGRREPVRVGVGDEHLGRAVLHGEQGRQQADDAGAGDDDTAAADAVGELVRARAGQLGGGVQQPVGADRSHLGEVDAEHRVDVVRHRHDHRAGREHVVRPVAVRRCDQRPDLHVGPAALDDLGHLHVAHGGHRVAPGRLAVDEHAELGVTTRPEGRVGALDVGELGAGRQAAPAGADGDTSVLERRAARGRTAPARRPPAHRATGRPANGHQPRATGRTVTGTPSRAERSAAQTRACVRRRLGVGHADAAPAAQRVEELAVLPGHRVLVGLQDTLAVRGAQPQLVVAQPPLEHLDGPSLGEQLQPDGVPPPQHAGRGQRADGAGGEAQGHRAGRRDVGLRQGGTGCGQLDRGHLVDLAGEQPDQVEQVGRLLHQLSAGALAPGPPGRAGGRVEPGAGDELDVGAGERVGGPLDDVERPPVVADGGEQPRVAHLLVDPDRGVEVGRERLLDEEGQPAPDGRLLERPVRERRDAQPHGVELLLREQGEPVGVRPRAPALGGRLGAGGVGVGDGDDLHVRERPEGGQVAAGDEAGADAGDAQSAHDRDRGPVASSSR